MSRLLGWKNFNTLHYINVYKNVPIAERNPAGMAKFISVPNMNAWANNKRAANMLASVLAKHPGKTRAQLYNMYLHNLALLREKQAPRAEKNAVQKRIKEYEARTTKLPPIKRFQLQNNGTWKTISSGNYIDKKNENKVFHRLSGAHLRNYPYLHRLVIRKNSPRLKGLEMSNNWHYIPHTSMRNFSRVKSTVEATKARLVKTQGEAAAHKRLLEVFNQIQRRRFAKGRGQFIGQVLRNQMYGTLYSLPPPKENVMKPKATMKPKVNSPPKQGPLLRTPSTVQRERALGIAGGANHPAGSPNNSHITWSRGPNGKINVHQTITNLQLKLTNNNRARIEKMNENEALYFIRHIARHRK